MNPEWRAPACYVGVALICLCYIAIVPGVSLTDIFAGAGLGAAIMWALNDWEMSSLPARPRRPQAAEPARTAERRPRQIRWQHEAPAGEAQQAAPSPDTRPQKEHIEDLPPRATPLPRRPQVRAAEAVEPPPPSARLKKAAPEPEGEIEAPIEDDSEVDTAQAKGLKISESDLRLEIAKLEALRKEIARQELALHREALRRPASAAKARPKAVETPGSTENAEGASYDRKSADRTRRPFH